MKFFRNHNLGVLPWNEANKIPTLSHWLSDVIPFYPCCLWQEEQSTGCQRFRFERRASQDCVGYQPPGGATVFGDPHIYTFDGMPYTFNGKGEFVLARADSPRVKLDVQGRFEQVEDSPYGPVMASQLTAVAAKDNVSSIVEVRLRPLYAQWRYKLDVLVDGAPIYFDRYPQKIQHFPGVTVYTPSNILNQSHVIMMFQSGAGVEVLENKHYMAARVYLPWEFINQTRGLFGNWTFDIKDDFTLPSGQYGSTYDTANIQRIHDEFAMKWVVHDKEEVGIGKSLFTHNNGQSSNTFYDQNFEPEWNIRPEIPLNVTWVNAKMVDDTCGESYQCKYDYSTSLSREFAIFSKYYQDQFVNIREGVLKPEARVISCGALPTPAFGRKSTFAFTPGTMVKFDCDPGYVLTGERRRWCYDTGDWNWAEKGEALCIPQDVYNTQQSGITAAIVVCIIVPLGICIICLIIHLRNRAIERSDFPQANTSEQRNAEQRFGPSAPNRTSGHSFGRKTGGSYDSDRDSGFHGNGKVAAIERNSSEDENVRYNNERFQRSAQREDSLKASMRKQGVDARVTEGKNNSERSDENEPGSPTLAEVVLKRPPVTRFPSSSGRSTPSSPTSTAPSDPLSRSNSSAYKDQQHPRGSGRSSASERSKMETPLTETSSNFQRQPIRGSDKSTSSEQSVNPPTISMVNERPLAAPPSGSGKNYPSSVNPLLQKEPLRGSGRSSTSDSSSKFSDPREGGAIPKTRSLRSGSSSNASAHSTSPPPLPSTLPPTMSSDASDEDLSPNEYDGVYFTNEPLLNKPPVDFPPKKMDVDIDIVNFEQGTKKPTAL